MPQMTLTPPASSTRRGLLKSLATSLGAKPVKALTMKVTPKGTAAPQPSLAVHAANRIMYGPRPGDVAAIEAAGYDAWLTQQLSPALLADTECDAALAALNLVTLTETRTQLYDRRNNASYDEVIRPIEEVRHATFTRILLSKRQLQERMVDFWHNHFNVYGWDYLNRSLWSDWDALLRAHAFGNFRAMLEATAMHPCMLYYLDNYISTNAGPNENYARECMELHTLGSDSYQTEGGYIDQDVYEASRCFTGWTFEQDGTKAERGQFKYNNDQHDRFIKYIFNTLFPGDQPALADGRKLLDMLAYHPGTARHIARKLAVRFVSDTPSEALVQATADVFYAQRLAPDQIRQTVGYLLRSDEFKNSRMTKMKRPLDWVCSAMRALGMSYTTDDSFFWLYDDLGPSIFSWRPPDGPPDTQEYWLSSNSLLRRWNWAFIVASEWYKDRGISFDASILPAAALTARQITQFWCDRLLGRTISSETFNSLVEFVADGRSWDVPLPADQRTDKSKFVAALCLTTPEFMRR
jgi:uncharacterized protein (DUF1800 family)